MRNRIIQIKDNTRFFKNLIFFALNGVNITNNWCFITSVQDVLKKRLKMFTRREIKYNPKYEIIITILYFTIRECFRSTDPFTGPKLRLICPETYLGEKELHYNHRKLVLRAFCAIDWFCRYIEKFSDDNTLKWTIQGSLEGHFHKHIKNFY